MTEEQIKYINGHYLKEPIVHMAKHLGFSRSHVRTVMRKLNLNVPDEIRRKRSGFKKGNIPWSKGKKMEDFMTKDHIESFINKKGELRRPEIPIRTIIIRTLQSGRKYKYIKIGVKKWILLSRHNWVEKFGPIPKSYQLICKTADTLNCDPGNWYLISRGDRIKKFSANKTLPDGWIAMMICGRNRLHLMDAVKQNKPLIEIKRQQIILNREIKKHEHNRQFQY
jgi:hypothetical protein